MREKLSVQKILGQRNIFWANRVLGPANFRSTKYWFQKNVRLKNLYIKKNWIKQNFFGLTICWPKIILFPQGPKRILGQKDFGSPKNKCGPENCFGP